MYSWNSYSKDPLRVQLPCQECRALPGGPCLRGYGDYDSCRINNGGDIRRDAYDYNNRRYENATPADGRMK